MGIFHSRAVVAGGGGLDPDAIPQDFPPYSSDGNMASIPVQTAANLYKNVNEPMMPGDTSDYVEATGDTQWVRWGIDPDDIPPDLVTVSGIDMNLRHCGKRITADPGADVTFESGGSPVTTAEKVDFYTADTVKVETYEFRGMSLSRAQMIDDFEVFIDYVADGAGGKVPVDFEELPV